MVSFIMEIINYHDYIMKTYGDPRVENWFIINSFWWILGIILAYLCFVLYVGPKFMENRKPFKIDKLLVIYNAIQVMYSLTLLTLATIYVLPYYSLRCEPCKFSQSDPDVMALNLGCGYLVAKIIELLDTVFFILKKNYRQLTFLHIYHHSEMVFFSWLGTRFIASGSTIYLGYMNTLVHVIMYSYYLASVFFKAETLMWVKKPITQIQIVQFVLICLVYTVIMLQPDCSYPKMICLTFIFQALLMLYLFLKFYFNNYVKRKVK